MFFAHPEIDCNNELFYDAKSFSFSSNFSQTLGTAKNIVGLTHWSVRTIEPYNASGLAKYRQWPTKEWARTSKSKPAIWESGKYETILSFSVNPFVSEIAS